MPQRILVVDDDRDIAELMRDFLMAEGYEVEIATEGAEALSRVTDQTDLILLDVMMPGMNGLDVLKAIREQRDTPVLFLSAREEDSDIIRGLGLGADDYVGKSASPATVVARVKAVLRRWQRDSAATPLTYGAIRIDPDAREVTRDSEIVNLTAREYELLELLATHPRQVLTREQIFERLWGPYGDRHSLTVHIGRLREKLEVDSTQPRLIVTVWGVGYRFEGER